MAYRVEIARRAESDLEELYLWVVERAPQRGAQWFNGSSERSCHSISIRSGVPSRPRASTPIAPSEYSHTGRKPHAYRIFFTVDNDAEIVRVLHVRRGARQLPIAEELKGD